MPISIGVGSKGVGTAVSVQATTGVTTTPGSFFEVGFVTDGALTVSSVVDSFSNTYVLVTGPINVAAGGGIAFVYRSTTQLGGASHTATVTMSGAGRMTVLFCEIKGASGFDLGNGVNDAASPFVSPSISTTKARELLVGMIGGDSASNPATHAESTGMLVLATAEELNGVANWVGCFASRVVSATGSYNCSFTENGSTNCAVFIGGWIEASAAGAGGRLFSNPGVGPFMAARFPAFQQGIVSSSIGTLEGAADQVSAVSADITGIGNLNGAAVVLVVTAATLTGALNGNGASIVGVVTVASGSLLGDLKGAAVANASAAAQGSLLGDLKGAVAALATSAAAITGTGALTGSSIGWSVTAGQLADGASANLTGASVLTTIASGQTSAIGQLQAASVSGIYTAAQLTGLINIQAASVGFTAALGSLTDDSLSNLSGAVVSMTIATAEGTSEFSVISPDAAGSVPGFVPSDIKGPYKRKGQIFGETFPVSPDLGIQQAIPATLDVKYVSPLQRMSDGIDALTESESQESLVHDQVLAAFALWAMMESDGR